MDAMEIHKWESSLFLCHQFWPEGAEAKTLPHVETTEATEPKYLPDPENPRSGINVLDAVGLSLLVKETTSAWGVSLWPWLRPGVLQLLLGLIKALLLYCISALSCWIQVLLLTEYINFKVFGAETNPLILQIGHTLFYVANFLTVRDLQAFLK